MSTEERRRAGGGGRPPLLPPAPTAASSSAFPAAAAVPSAPSSLPSALTSRVIMHCDMDCFYAQVDRERFPHWRGSPIAVVQNGKLIVTSNYRVRHRGYQKIGPPANMSSCPGIKFSGSSMDRYRAASRAWYDVFRSYDPLVVVMKKSIDESYLDLTEACRARIREGRVYRVEPQSKAERERIDRLAKERMNKATAAWKAANAVLVAQGVLPHDLESTGALHSAQLFSRSMDPITELRREAAEKMLKQRGGAGSSVSATAAALAAAAGPQVNPLTMAPLPIPKPPHLEGLTEEEIEERCNQLHPLDYCRADKRHGAIELRPLQSGKEEGEEEEQPPLEGLDTAPWRQFWTGYVFHDGTDPKKPHEQEASVDAADDAPSPLLAPDEALPPPPSSSFAHEDPNNPSHDYLLMVGSQLCWEIRERLFETIGFTTSAAVAPNCMLAKLASSIHKPNQQSVVRACVARTFIAPQKLRAVTGFGPKAEVLVTPHGLVTVSDVQQLPANTLYRLFPERFAEWLLDVAQGIDHTVVAVHEAPKTLGQSKAQRTTSHEQRVILLQWLCAELMKRIVDDEREYSRRPTTLSLYWSGPGVQAEHGMSRRAPLPPFRTELAATDSKTGSSPSPPLHQPLLDVSMKLLKTHIPPNAVVRVMGVSASQFVKVQLGKGIRGFFKEGAAHSNNSSSSSKREAQSNQTASSSSPFPSAKSRSPLSAFFTHSTSSSSSASSGSSPVSAAASPSISSSARPVPPVPSSAAPSRAPPPPPSLPLPLPSAADSEWSDFEEDIEILESDPEPEHAQDEIEHLFLDAHRQGAAEQEKMETGRMGRKEEVEHASAAVPLPPPAPSPSPAAAASFSSSSSSSSSSLPAPVLPIFVCPDCHQSLPVSQQAEHADFHLAAKIQAEIRAADRMQREREQMAQAAAMATANSANGKRKKGKGAASPAAGTVPLARFMRPVSQASPAAAAGAQSPPPSAGKSKRSTTSQPSPNTLKSFFAAQPERDSSMR